jgi:hypothetical protein
MATVDNEVFSGDQLCECEFEPDISENLSHQQLDVMSAIFAHYIYT